MIVVVRLSGNKRPDSNRFTSVSPKSENDVRLQFMFGNQNLISLSVLAVRFYVYHGLCHNLSDCCEHIYK